MHLKSCWVLPQPTNFSCTFCPENCTNLPLKVIVGVKPKSTYYNKIAKKIFTGFMLNMNISIKDKRYISFQRRNKDIRLAQNVLHIIKSEYDSSSPYMINLLSEKHLKKPMSGRNLTNKKLYAFRQVQKNHLTSDLEYTRTLLDVFKQARAANCKEYSELAFIISKLNGIKDCNCVNFARLQPNRTFADIEHTVLLINQKVPENKFRLHKIYSEDVTENSAFRPSKKSIVIDPLFGIVDYWDNAVIRYQSIYPEISRKNLYVGGRDLILKNNADIDNIRQMYPGLLINKKQTQPKSNLLKRIIDVLFNIFKQDYQNHC